MIPPQAYAPSDQAAVVAASSMPPVSQPIDTKGINFGKILKYALIGSAVLLAGMVAFYALTAPATAFAVTHFLTGLPLLGPVMGGFIYAANFGIGFFGTLGGMALHAIGITGASSTATIGTGAAVGTGITLGGAALVHGAPAVATPAPVASPTPVHPAGEDAIAMSAHTASTAAKIGHHAGEHQAEPSIDWKQRVGASVAYHRTLASGGSFADAVRAAHDTVASRVNPRNSSFAQQVNADRAALEAALSDPQR